MKNHTSIILFASSALAALTLATPVAAGLVVYEGFDYPTGSALAGQNGGTGFAGAWGSSAGLHQIQAPGLNYMGQPAVGGRLYLDATPGQVGIFRDFSAARGADGTTTWMSLISQRTGPTGGTFGPNSSASYLRPLNFALFEAGTERLALGEGTRNSGISLPDTDVWGLVVGGNVNNTATSWTTAPLANESLALVRIDHGVGNVDTAYMWINPDITAEPDIATAMAMATGNFGFNRIRPFAGNASAQSGNIAAQGYFDEFRVGDSWSAVIVPEPAPMALMSLVGMAGFWMWRVRRRQA
jgi:hypothetical protein